MKGSEAGMLFERFGAKIVIGLIVFGAYSHGRSDMRASARARGRGYSGSSKCCRARRPRPRRGPADSSRCASEGPQEVGRGLAEEMSRPRKENEERRGPPWTCAGSSTRAPSSSWGRSGSSSGMGHLSALRDGQPYLIRARALLILTSSHDVRKGI